MQPRIILAILFCLFGVTLGNTEVTSEGLQIQSAQVVGTIHNTRGQWNPFLEENNMQFNPKRGGYERVVRLSPKGGRNADGIYAIRFYVNHDINKCFKFLLSETGIMVMALNVDQANNQIFKVNKVDDYNIYFNPSDLSFDIYPKVEILTKIESMQLNGFVYDCQGELEHTDDKRTYPAEKWDETIESHQMKRNSDGSWSKKVYLMPKGGMHKDGIYQILFSANRIGDWGYSAINGQPGKLSGAGGYDSRLGRIIDSAIVFKVWKAGEYTITAHPFDYWYAIDPEVEHLNDLRKFQINGYVVDDPWNPHSKSHEMKEDKNGMWTKIVSLSPKGGLGKDGVYSLNFSIDNNWHQDSIGMGGIWGKTWHALPQEYNIMFKVMRSGEYEIKLDPQQNEYSISPEVLPITKIYSFQIVGNFPEFIIDGSDGWNPFHPIHQMDTEDGLEYFYDLLLKKGKTYSYKYTANNAGWNWVFSDYPYDGYSRLSLHGDPPALKFTPDKSGLYRFNANIVTGEYSVRFVR